MVPDITVVFTLDERRLQLRFRALPIGVWSELKHALKFTPKTLLEGAQDGDIEAALAIVWLERRQRERNLSWLDVRRDVEKTSPEFEIVDLLIKGVSQVGRDGGESADVDDAEDPTKAGQ